MKKSELLTDELAEFLQFPESKSDEEAVPPLSETLRRQVRADLHPSVLRIGLKLLGVYGSAGALTMTVCPQFGVGPLGGGHGLMGVFMEFGYLACAAGCGSFFMGSIVLAALMILNRDELRVVRQQGAGVGYLSALSALSLALFMVIGNASDETWGYLLVWALTGVGLGVMGFAFWSKLRPLLRASA